MDPFMMLVTAKILDSSFFDPNLDTWYCICSLFGHLSDELTPQMFILKQLCTCSLQAHLKTLDTTMLSWTKYLEFNANKISIETLIGLNKKSVLIWLVWIDISQYLQKSK